MPDFDVAIVGAGAVGAALALALAPAGLSVALIADAPPPPAEGSGWDPRTYALSPGNAAWLETLGVWGALPAGRRERIERMHVFGDRAPGKIEFSAYDAGLRELAWIVENRLLQAALWARLETAPHVQRFCPARCHAVEWRRDAADLLLEDGRTLAARLVVGADGARSWVRGQMGVDTHVDDYRAIGVVANFATAVSHRGVAWQWFREDGVLALLPLPGKRVSMVWSAPEAHARTLLRADAQALAGAVEVASVGVLGGLEVITPAAGFPLSRLRVASLVEPRAALVGDAAHGVHPLAGQGMNLGLRDARELARVLCRRGGYRDCGDYRLLRRYARARAEDVALIDATTHGLEKLFGSRAVWMAALRNFGLASADTLAPLKTRLVRQAAA